MLEWLTLKGQKEVMLEWFSMPFPSLLSFLHLFRILKKEMHSLTK